MKPKSILRAAGAAALASLVLVPLAASAVAGDGATSDGPRPGDPSRTPADVAMELDFLIEAAWRAEGLEPTAPCGDAEFARRVYLDLVGVIPTADQVERFVARKDPDKRALLVDDLLASAGHARHETNRWSHVLIGQGTSDNNREFVPALFRRWVEEGFRSGRTWPAMVREVVTATGTAYESPAVNFSGRLSHAPTDLAGAVSKSFLGVQIQCAQCHDHPYEAITQADFNGFASFWAYSFGRPKLIDYSMLGPGAAARAERQVQSEVERLMKEGRPEAEARAMAERRRPRTRDVQDFDAQVIAAAGNPRAQRRVLDQQEKRLGEIGKTPPKFLLGDVYTDARGGTRRAALADWILDPGNPYTSRALANRYWGWLLGRGFVHPVDDFSSVNIPSIPAALDLLAQDTADHGFDTRRLLRIITRTRAYQLSTAVSERSPHAEEFFAAGPLKELTPQQAFDSLQVALGVQKDPTAMSGLDASAPSSVDMAGGRGGMMMAGADGEISRAERLLQAAARSYFQTFEDDEGGETEAFTGTVPQGLFLLNSEVVNNLLVNPAISVVPGIVSGFSKESERVRHLFLRTLSREPTAAEMRRFTHFVKNAETLTEAVDLPDGKGGPGRRVARRRTGERRENAAYADLLWALLSTSEFATNH